MDEDVEEEWSVLHRYYRPLMVFLNYLVCLHFIDYGVMYSISM